MFILSEYSDKDSNLFVTSSLLTIKKNTLHLFT